MYINNECLLFLNLSLIFIINFHVFYLAQSCQWQSYKTINEGPYQGGTLIFRVERSIQICVNSKTIYQIRTTRKLILPLSAVWVCQSTNNFGDCSGSCSSKIVIIPITCTSTNLVSTTVSFNYYNKNCDKIYRSNWNQVTNCSNSRSRVFTRTAKDCDQQPFPSDYNVNGYIKKKEEPCQPMWNEWVTVFCNSTNNTMKEQVRTRKCLYGDGSETNNTRLCSNESAIITNGTCFPATTQLFDRKRPDDQTLNKTMEINENSRFIYIAAGVFFLVFTVIGIAILIIRFRHHKKPKTNHIQLNNDVDAAVTKKEQENTLYQSTTLYETESIDEAISHEAKFGVSNDMDAAVTKKEQENTLYQSITLYVTESNDEAISHEAKFGFNDDMDAAVTKKEQENTLYQSTTLYETESIDEAISHEAKFGVNNGIDAAVTKKEQENILYQSTTLYETESIDEAISHEAKFGFNDDMDAAVTKKEQENTLYQSTALYETESIDEAISHEAKFGVNNGIDAAVTKKEQENILYQSTTLCETESIDEAISPETKFGFNNDVNAAVTKKEQESILYQSITLYGTESIDEAISHEAKFGVNNGIDAAARKKEQENTLYQSTTLYETESIDEVISHETKFGVKDDSTYETLSTA